MFSNYQSGTMDVSLNFFGYENCSPGYSYGPSIREIYVLHYITHGQGRFYYQNNVINLREGDFFLLKPNELTFYQADDKNPWSYYWLGLGGTKIADYFRYSRINELTYWKNSQSCDTQKIAEQLITLAETANQSKGHNSHLHLLGRIYELLFQLSQAYPSQDTSNYQSSYQLYLDAKHMIDTRYLMTDLSIQSIADTLSINRSYLTTIFKEYQQQSPKEYLLHIRMHRAKQLLESTKESIKVIAFSVGFSDPLYFSKAFKKFWHCSPREMREKEPETKV